MFVLVLFRMRKEWIFFFSCFVSGHQPFNSKLEAAKDQNVVFVVACIPLCCIHGVFGDWGWVDWVGVCWLEVPPTPEAVPTIILTVLPA